MTDTPVLVDLTPEEMYKQPCCGVKNPEHEGRRSKLAWCKNQFKRGLRAKVLMTPDKRQCGYIEYLPGEYAWRGVEAQGYLFIHCIWTYYRRYQHKGWAGMMIRACVEEARNAGMNGVAVLTREGPWLAGREVFLRNGFQTVASAPPDYELLVFKVNPSAPDPELKTPEGGLPKKHGRGLVIVRAAQCPHAMKFAREIAEAASKDYGLKPRIVDLRSCREAQSAPTPYAVFSVFHDGRLLADHPISCTRFRNIMKKELREPGARKRSKA